MNQTSILQEIGFTSREERVYKVLIEIGPSTVGPIVNKTGLPHAKVYDTLRKLTERGLASFVMIHKRKQFQALSPKQLLVMMDEKRRSLSELVKELENKKRIARESQTATVYEGHKAIKSMFDILLNDLTRKDFYRVFAFTKEYMWSQDAKDILIYVHSTLAEKGVNDWMISHMSVRPDVLRTYKSIKNMQIKFTDQHFPQGLIISKGRVINFIWSNRPTAFEIRSLQMFEQYKRFFEDVWQKSKT